MMELWNSLSNEFRHGMYTILYLEIIFIGWATSLYIYRLKKGHKELDTIMMHYCTGIILAVLFTVYEMYRYPDDKLFISENINQNPKLLILILSIYMSPLIIILLIIIVSSIKNIIHSVSDTINVIAEKDLEIIRIDVKVGAHVSKGTILAWCKDKDNESFKILSPDSGIIKMVNCHKEHKYTNSSVLFELVRFDWNKAKKY